MKIGFKIAAAIDAITLIVSGCLIVYLNSRDAYGMAALEDMGRFVLCLILFVAALIIGVILGIVALISYLKRRKK